MDLINEGNIGLIKGIEYFDYTFKAKISTYVSWWIHQAIRRYMVNHMHDIRLPVHIADCLRQIQRTQTAFENDQGRPPTTEELSEATGLTTDKITNTLGRQLNITHLQRNIGEDGKSGQIEELIPDPNSNAGTQQFEQTDETKPIKSYLKTLDPCSQIIIDRRFGLTSGTPETLAAIAKDYGITRERVRQLEDKAIRRIRRKLVIRAPQSETKPHILATRRNHNAALEKKRKAAVNKSPSHPQDRRGRRR
jgi:RNA polymerase primary sigma factor